jgi:hypothetical protein
MKRATRDIHTFHIVNGDIPYPYLTMDNGGKVLLPAQRATLVYASASDSQIKQR